MSVAEVDVGLPFISFMTLESDRVMMTRGMSRNESSLMTFDIKLSEFLAYITCAGSGFGSQC